MRIKQPKETNYCRKCGSDSLLVAGEFDNVQRHRRDVELKDMERRQQRNLAIRKIQEMETHTFCVSCDVDFKDASSFCTRCGANISKQRVPDQTVFEVVQAEYPRTVQTWQNYLTLKSSSPERGVGRRGFLLSVAKILDPVEATPSTATHFLIVLGLAVFVATAGLINYYLGG
jgi:ribosomal protein L37E